jgi:hypothetical protein
MRLPKGWQRRLDSMRRSGLLAADEVKLER